MQTHVVHTFNTDMSKQGTVEALPDTVARSLIRTGRARIATEDEIASGTAAPAEPAEDQAPPGAAADPTAAAGGVPDPAGKVTAVPPKPSAAKVSTTSTPVPTAPPASSAPASGDTAGK